MRSRPAAWMGTLRDDLRAIAEEAVAKDLLVHDPFHAHREEIAVVLGGSGTTDDCDEYSGCDFFVFVPPEQTWWQNAGGAGWQTVRREQFRYRYRVQSGDELLAAVQRGEDAALYLIANGQVLHDPAGKLLPRWQVPHLGEEVWRRKLAARYKGLRDRRASLAWALRRGQMITVLQDVQLLLEHGLSCCFYLQRQPAPPAKWLFRGALRTPAGRVLRQPVLDLLSALGDLAVLGGSLNLHHNRLYQRTGEVQVTLEAVLQQAGYPVPQLAAQAEDLGQDSERHKPRVRLPGPLAAAR